MVMEMLCNIVDYILWADDIVRGIISVASIGLVIIGVINCFFGYKVFRISMALIGGIIGGLIGVIIGAVATLNTGGVVIISVMSALAAGLISYELFLLGVFLSTFISGFLLSLALVTVLVGNTYTAIMAGIFVGLALGVLGCVFIKQLLIIITAITGAVNIAFGLWILTGSYIVGVLSIIPLSIAGFLAQKHMEKEAGIGVVDRVIVNGGRSNGISNPLGTLGEGIISKSNGSTRKILLKNAFPPDIYEEIKNIVPRNSIGIIKYVPYELSNGEWLCGCGEVMSSEECRFCGLNKADAIEKINYSYLQLSRNERLKEERK